MHLKMTERHVGIVTILDLAGDLTIDQGVERFKDKINSLLQQGHTQILVNLADVPYVDSGGLGQLVASYTSLTRVGGRMKLLRANAKNQHLLVITRLVTVFDTFESETEALASFQPAREGSLTTSPR
jgi:anti-sigma B factor antagonist